MRNLPPYVSALAVFAAYPAHAESFKMTCFPGHAAPYTVSTDGAYITASRSGTTRRYDVIDRNDNQKRHVLYLATQARGQTRTVYLAFDYSQKGNDVSDIRVIDRRYDAVDKCSFIPKEVYQAQPSSPIPIPIPIPTPSPTPAPAQAAAPANTTPAPPPNAATQTQDKPPETGRSLATSQSSSGAQDILGAQEIASMHTSYEDNQARFRRDYIGRQFSADLPIGQISESLFSSDTLVISLGSGALIGDVSCKVTGEDNIRVATELHKGQIVHVTGTVYDHSFGSIDLKECLVQR